DRSTVDLTDVDNYEPSQDAPIDDDPDALRGTLWLLTDSKFKRALSDYAKKRGQRVNSVPEDEDLPSFSKEPAQKHLDGKTAFSFDANVWAERVRKTSALFRNHPELFDAGVKVSADRVTRYFVNSEGSVMRTERTIYGCHLSAAARA